MKLSEINEDAILVLVISNEDRELKLQAVFKKAINSKAALIEVPSYKGKALNFSNVQISVEYIPDNGAPFIWRNAVINYVKGQYVLGVPSDGIRHNRRSCFRVNVAQYARMRKMNEKPVDVIVRDLSLTGFSLADRTGDLQLDVGNDVTVAFSDLGYDIRLVGKVVRIEEEEGRVVYGLVTRNLCNDVGPYITLKQQRNRKANMR